MAMGVSNSSRPTAGEARGPLSAEQKFAQQLIALHEVNLELSMIDSVDDLCRAAVEMAICRLGFERLSIWMVDPADDHYILGAFGVDEHGVLRDERQRRVLISPGSNLQRLVATGLPFIYAEDSPLYNDNSEPVGMGNKALASLWDGQQLIGIMSVDNLIKRQPITEYQCKLLDVFARMVGHLLTLKRTQQKLIKTNRALHTLGECNQLMVRATDETSLLDGVCQMLATIGGYRRCGIMLVEAETGVWTAAQADAEPGARPEWAEAVEAARRTGRPQFIIDPSAAPEATAMAAVPLLFDDQVVGCLNLWTAERDRFDAKEIALLTELAADIAFGLHTLRLRAERQEAEAAIHQLNEELERRVTERTAQLEVANQELEAFSYSISHDLRAPLRSIDGYSQALMEEYSSQLGLPGQNYLRRIRTAAQRMSELIDALLGLSRLMRGELKRMEIDVSALAREIAQELRRQDEERRVEFIIAGHLTASADPRLLRAVLENLLGNAWKFTSKTPEARIEFGTIRPDRKVRVYFVRDNGAGFDMTYADKLFGTFERLHTADEFPGHGIGLAIVYRIIHRHGGRVWAESQVDKGATFYFTLAKS